MSKKIINFLMFITLGFIPLLIHIMLDIIIYDKIEYTNYLTELYFFNLFSFAYGIMRYFDRKHLVAILFNKIQLVIFVLGLTLSTCIYSFSFLKNLIDLKLASKHFFLLIILALLSFIINLMMEIASHMNADWCYFEERYKKEESENRYERYLLERIDEKLNSIKNQQSEKSEEQSNDTINSKELLSGSDILAEMLKNHIEIQEYFQISKNQSKFSFYFSICSSVVGIIVVIIAASGIIIFKSLGISIIAAASGAITEIISGIVLWIHNKSALQLNYYYDSLHENEKFLSALNIADKLSEEKREDMYIEIIRKQIDIQLKDRENNVTDADKE
ncbi:hypothetical protein FMM75_22995 [Lachnospiraceae bacterium MD335]|nr:hypothetical protein [Lachnospiraceae bacterium MD335]